MSKGWVAVTRDAILLKIVARDAVHENHQTGGTIFDGDSIQVAVDARGDGSGSQPPDTRIGFDKQGLGPQSVDETPAGTFFAVVSEHPYDALPPRDRSWQDIGPRGKLGDALPGVGVDGPLCLRTPDRKSADAAAATRFGFFMPAQAAKAADGFDAQTVPAQRCVVRIYRGPAEGLLAALEATRASARKAGLELTGEEWQLLWSAGGRGGQSMRELRLVVRHGSEDQ